MLLNSGLHICKQYFSNKYIFAMIASLITANLDLDLFLIEEVANSVPGGSSCHRIQVTLPISANTLALC